MITKIWERYFFKEQSKIFFFILFGFYGLYILVDYSTRHTAYHSIGFSFFDIAAYYSYIFIQRIEILIPFAFIITSVKTLCSLNIHNELIALQASGVRLKRLLMPFITFALFLTLFLYINNQLFIPLASKSLKQLEEKRIKGKYKKEDRTNIHNIILNDNSVILYHSYDSSNQFFYDVFWIHSMDDVYHMKYLHPFEQVPRGEFVDHFSRNENNVLTPKGSFPTIQFHELNIDPKILSEILLTPHDMSITQLWQRLPSFFGPYTEHEAKIATAFYRKISIPWLSLLGFIAVAPFCLHFTRKLPVFFIYLASIFGIVAFYLTLNAGIVLSENQVLSPIIAILGPMSLMALFFGWRFYKL